MKFLCLNYRNSAPAWFDHLVLMALHLSTQAADVTIVAATTEEGRQRQGQIQAVVEQLDLPVAMTGAVPSFGDCRLLVVPEWQYDDTFLERVKTFYYRGGRQLPDAGLAAESGGRGEVWPGRRRREALTVI